MYKYSAVVLLHAYNYTSARILGCFTSTNPLTISSQLPLIVLSFL